MRDFKQLTVWQKAHALALGVYRASMGFPADERFGLTSQIRRAASSIPANIAEGYGRTGDAELARFVSIACGSATELEYHLLLSKDLSYLASHDHAELDTAVQEVKRMLVGLLTRLQPKTPR